MRHRTRLAFLPLCLLLLSGCSHAARQVEADPTPSPSPPPVEAAAFTVEALLENSLPPDVPRDAPGAPAVAWACHTGLLQPEADGSFHPDDPVDQTTVLNALARHPSGAAVPTADWFGQENAAAEPVSRLALARALYRCASPAGFRAAALADFLDGESIPQEDRPALSWAADSVFRDFLGCCLLPNFPVTRSQLAQALLCLESPSKETELVVSEQHAAATGGVGVSVERAEQIQGAIDRAAEKYGAMGVQVAVVEKGRLCGCFAGGWATAPAGADYENARNARLALEAAEPNTLVEYHVDGELMSTEHKLRCASISKVVLGMAAVSLAEDGVVDLHESIGTYWDCTVENTAYPDETVCIDNILSHTSTIVAAGDNAAYDNASVKRTISARCTSGKPGDISAWTYNNFAFGVLGMTLEQAAGQMTDEILNERFFDQLDIDAAFRPGRISNQQLVTLYRAGHEERNITRQRQLGELSYAPGSYGGLFSGGLTISARDLGKLTCVLAGDGCYEGLRLLDEDSVAYMERSAGTAPDGFQQCHPLRCQEEMYGRARLYYHTGSAWGAYNCLSYDPETGDGVVVLTSGASSRRDAYGVYAICGDINQEIYDILK